jgi:hypothetical protein
MQSQVFLYQAMQGKGKSPLPLHSIPKTNNNSKTQEQQQNQNQEQQQNQNQNQNQEQEQNQGRLHRRLDTPVLRKSALTVIHHRDAARRPVADLHQMNHAYASPTR